MVKASIFLIIGIAIVGCGAEDQITPPPEESPFLELYLEKDLWIDRVRGYVGEDKIVEFPTTAENVSLATEVSGPPTQNVSIGPVNTYDSTVTGFCFSFHLSTLQPGSQMTFDDWEFDNPQAPAGYRDRAISIGDCGNFEDDDFEIMITARDAHYKVIGIGIEVIDNALENDESIEVHCADTTQDTIYAESPDCDGTGAFIGIVSNQELLKLIFNESPGGDDIFVRDFYFVAVRK
jgi:hypothetical protein